MKKYETMFAWLDVPIELSDYNISYCKQRCPDYVIKTQYRCLYENDSEIIMKKLIDADVNLIVDRFVIRIRRNLSR